MKKILLLQVSFPLVCLLLCSCLSQKSQISIYLDNNGQADLVVHSENIHSSVEGPAVTIENQQWLNDFKLDTLPIHKHLQVAGASNREKYLIRGELPFAAIHTARFRDAEALVKLIDPQQRYLRANLSRGPGWMAFELAPKPLTNKEEQEKQSQFISGLLRKDFNLRFIPIKGQIESVEGLDRKLDAAVIQKGAKAERLFIKWRTDDTPLG